MADFPRIVFLPGHTERDIRAIDVVEADGRARLDRATLETIIVRYLREHGYFVGQLRRQKMPHVLLLERLGDGNPAERSRAQD